MTCSAWGALGVLGSALTNFPCELRLKIFFLRPGGAGAPTAPPAYAYEYNVLQLHEIH